MSDPTRTAEEYIERYAKQYCNGDVEAAKTHIMVREVVKEKDMTHEKENGNRATDRQS